MTAPPSPNRRRNIVLAIVGVLVLSCCCTTAFVGQYVFFHRDDLGLPAPAGPPPPPAEHDGTVDFPYP